MSMALVMRAVMEEEVSLFVPFDSGTAHKKDSSLISRIVWIVWIVCT